MTSILIALLALAMSAMVFLAYRQGLKDGRCVSRDEPIPPIRKQRRKENKELQRLRALQNNIQNYNGTAQGQEKVVK